MAGTSVKVLGMRKQLTQRGDTPIDAVVRAATGVKKSWPSFLLLDRLTASQKGSWLFDCAVFQPLTAWPPIVYGRMRSDCSLSLVYGVKIRW